jgi:hypothetical protein
MSHTTAEPKSRTLAIIALAVAAASLPLGWFAAPVGLLLPIIGLVLGVVAFIQVRQGKAEGKGLAIAAIIVSILSIVGLLGLAAWLAVVLLGGAF